MTVRFKEVPGGTVPKLGPELLGQLWQHGQVAALPTLGLGNQEHLLVKEEFLNLNVGKL